MNDLPRLYAKYIGHDDNRDFYMSNMKETTNMNRQLFMEWFPQIMYNHHQTGPAGAVIFMPPFRDPFNYNFDPLMPLGIEMVGTAMHSRLVAEGKGGSAMRSGANYSTWWNGGLRTVTYFHNMIGILTEIIGSPDADATFRWSPTSSCRRAIWPLPIAPQKWHYRQSIDYEMTANRAMLDLASRYREDFLFNIWRMGMNSIESGSRDSLDRHAEAHRSAGSAAAAERGGRRRPSAGRGVAAAAHARASSIPGAARSCQVRSVCTIPQCAIRAATSFPSDQPDFATATEVRQRAAQERHHRPPRHRRFRGGRQELSGGLVRGEDRAGIPPARAGHVRAAGPPQRFRVSRRSADPPYDITGWTLAMQMGVQFDRILDGVRRSVRNG